MTVSYTIVIYIHKLKYTWCTCFNCYMAVYKNILFKQYSWHQIFLLSWSTETNAAWLMQGLTPVCCNRMQMTWPSCPNPVHTLIANYHSTSCSLHKSKHGYPVPVELVMVLATTGLTVGQSAGRGTGRKQPMNMPCLLSSLQSPVHPCVQIAHHLVHLLHHR